MLEHFSTVNLDPHHIQMKFIFYCCKWSEQKDVVTQEWKVCNMEIDIVTFVVKGSVKLTVPTD